MLITPIVPLYQVSITSELFHNPTLFRSCQKTHLKNRKLPPHHRTKLPATGSIFYNPIQSLTASPPSTAVVFQRNPIPLLLLPDYCLIFNNKN